MGWGESVVEWLSRDLQQAFPGLTGFSAFNLWRMRQLYMVHSSPEFLAQLVPVMQKARSARETKRIPAQLVPELLATIPWGHHVELLKKVKDHKARLFYLHGAAKLGWSRNVLLNQIKARAFERSLAEGKTHNFPAVLPEYLAEQAKEALKSSYNLEFLGIDTLIPIGGDEEVTVYRAGPGFWIGDSALLAETTRSITVSAAVESRVFRVPINAVRRALAEHPEDWICFFRLNHANAILAVSILAEVLSLPPRARFARMLLRQAGPDGSVQATQEDLGRLAGMSRAAFRRALSALIEAGALRTHYGGVQIVDRTALQRAAEER